MSESIFEIITISFVAYQSPKEGVNQDELY